MLERIGEVIDGRYELMRLLGRGGMGSVYEARAIAGGHRVAVKIIEPSHKRDDAQLARFQREARFAAAVDTRNIVQVSDAGADARTGVRFLVMDYLVGEDLQHLLDRVGTLPPELALGLVAQVCVGLQKAHDARVVHRDIKPANLFLMRDERGEIVVKILDFGIAKILDEPSKPGALASLTKTGSVLGSPLYMPPEQARGRKQIDWRADVWSLGVVLYRALAGRTPHTRTESVLDLLMTICMVPPPPIEQLAPGIAPEVAAITDRALRLDPAERFQSAAEMRAAIEALIPRDRVIRAEELASLEARPIAPGARAAASQAATEAGPPSGATPPTLALGRLDRDATRR
jgi:serine/threonine protein kinase